MIPEEILLALTEFIGPVSGSLILYSSEPLSGGCINHVHRLETPDGNFCIKYNRKEVFPGMFESEATGLTTLRTAGEIKVPAVIGTGVSEHYSFILLEFIHSSKRTDGFMEDFGHCLARLHRHTKHRFGFPENNYMGSLPQCNSYHSDWAEFFIRERLEPQTELARKNGYLTADDMVCFGSLYRHLEKELLYEPPSLLHGDLWGGNYMVSDEGRACLIDPAVYFGHREVDLAMSRLFGGFDPDFYRSYEEEFPLEKGWNTRVDIYNLYPLLVHLNLFGTGYYGSVKDIIKKFC
jgi:protein-ribulosamine 3-kinase